MAEFDIIFDNSEVKQKLQEFVDKGMNEALAKGLEKACLIIEGKAKKNCPVDDGQLRQSITHDVDIANAVGEIGSNVEYAPWTYTRGA